MEDEAPTVNPVLSSGQQLDEFYNVAWRKKASQSSTAHGGTADKAVDGWTAQNWAGWVVEDYTWDLLEDFDCSRLFRVFQTFSSIDVGTLILRQRQ